MFTAPPPLLSQYTLAWLRLNLCLFSFSQFFSSDVGDFYSQNLTSASGESVCKWVSSFSASKHHFYLLFHFLLLGPIVTCLFVCLHALSIITWLMAFCEAVMFFFLQNTCWYIVISVLHIFLIPFMYCFTVITRAYREALICFYVGWSCCCFTNFINSI